MNQRLEHESIKKIGRYCLVYWVVIPLMLLLFWSFHDLHEYFNFNRCVEMIAGFVVLIGLMEWRIYRLTQALIDDVSKESQNAADKSAKLTGDGLLAEAS